MTETKTISVTTNQFYVVEDIQRCGQINPESVDGRTLRSLRARGIVKPTKTGLVLTAAVRNASFVEKS